jgi:beta-mannosidase
VWQLNDCWPVTSWAIIDYFVRPPLLTLASLTHPTQLRPKPAYYAIKRELAPFTVGIFRTVGLPIPPGEHRKLTFAQVEKNRAHDRPRQFYEFGNFQATAAAVDVWGTNATRAPRAVVLEVTFVDLGASGWTHAVETSAHILAPNAATELAQVPVAAPSGTTEPDAVGATVVVGVVLRDAETREVVARTADWPQPLALLDFPDPGLQIGVARAADGDASVTISVARPVKGLFLQAAPGGDHDGEVVWDDNALDVMPGDPRVVVAKGLGSRRVQAAYMGREKARYVDES